MLYKMFCSKLFLNSKNNYSSIFLNQKHKYKITKIKMFVLLNKKNIIYKKQI